MSRWLAGQLYAPAYSCRPHLKPRPAYRLLRVSHQPSRARDERLLRLHVRPGAGQRSRLAGLQVGSSAAPGWVSESRCSRLACHCGQETSCVSDSLHEVCSQLQLDTSRSTLCSSILPQAEARCRASEACSPVQVPRSRADAAAQRLQAVQVGCRWWHPARLDCQPGRALPDAQVGSTRTLQRLECKSVLLCG